MPKLADKKGQTNIQRVDLKLPDGYLQALDEIGGETVKMPVEQPSQSPYNKEVKLQLCIDAHAHYDGPVTGKHYEWARAGSVVVVDALDAPVLLEKRIKAQSCCSGSDVSVFQIVD